MNRRSLQLLHCLQEHIEIADITWAHQTKSRSAHNCRNASDTHRIKQFRDMHTLAVNERLPARTGTADRA
jgi:hypothetical protein